MSFVTMKELLEAGVHFGHQTRRWNPKMEPYIFGARNGIHIIDLQKTVQFFKIAYNYVMETVADGGVVLFVGTKKTSYGRHCRRGQPVRHVLRQPPLAGRHAHQLCHHQPLHRAPP